MHFEPEATAEQMLLIMSNRRIIQALHVVLPLAAGCTHLPMSVRRTPAASSSLSTAVAAMDTTSSLSPQNVIASCKHSSMQHQHVT
jgi:hypothetical protein